MFAYQNHSNKLISNYEYRWFTNGWNIFKTGLNLQNPGVQGKIIFDFVFNWSFFRLLKSKYLIKFVVVFDLYQLIIIVIKYICCKTQCWFFLNKLLMIFLNQQPVRNVENKINYKRNKNPKNVKQYCDWYQINKTTLPWNVLILLKGIAVEFTFNNQS